MTSPITITIRGREYAVERVRDKADDKGVVYLLAGKRGARWLTMRNVHHPAMMFLINERSIKSGFRVSSQMMEGVWLTDEGGQLRVRSQ